MNMDKLVKNAIISLGAFCDEYVKSYKNFQMLLLCFGEEKAFKYLLKVDQDCDAKMQEIAFHILNEDDSVFSISFSQKYIFYIRCAFGQSFLKQALYDDTYSPDIPKDNHKELVHWVLTSHWEKEKLNYLNIISQLEINPPYFE